MSTGRDGHSTLFSNVYSFYLDNRGELVDWFNGIARTAVGISMSQAVVLAIEARLGRRLSMPQAAAVGWIANVSYDIEQKLQSHEKINRGALTQVAITNAHAVLQTSAIQSLSNLPLHAAGQISTMIDHIQQHHLR